MMDRTPAAQFAALLLARHARFRPWIPAAQAVLRRGAVSQQTLIHQHLTRISIAPTFALTLRAPLPAITRAANAVQVADRREAGPHGPARVDRVGIHRHGQDEGSVAAPGYLVAPVAESLFVRAPAAVAPPATRVLRRQPAATAATAPVAAAADSQVAHRPRPAPTPVPRAPTLTSVEMSRLTDQVMHTLDRRLASFRERHGRS